MSRHGSRLTPLDEAIRASIASRRPLLAFDFDGTLAPIERHPEDARVPGPTAKLLARLAELCQLAIVTGRRVDDVRPRLGFSPWRIVGSHGAECPTDPDRSKELARALNGLRQKLTVHQHALAGAGVVIEDKQQSIALHYATAMDCRRAMATIQHVLDGVDSTIHVFGGKNVTNLVPAQAPNKAQAVQSLLAASRAQTVVYAGDDVNDEPVFETAPADWLTVRVGSSESTRARIVVESQLEMPGFLECLLGVLTSNPRLSA